MSAVRPAALTPFEPDGAIDEDALAAHVAHPATTPGVSAMIVIGHAGEGTSLDRDARTRVIETARLRPEMARAIVGEVVCVNQQGEEVAAATHLMKAVG